MVDRRRPVPPTERVTEQVVRHLDRIERASGRDGMWNAPPTAHRLFWSYVFPLERRSAEGRRAYFAKIPVAEFRKSPLLPLTQADRSAGRAEWEALQRLRERWPKSGNAIRIVEPAHFVEEANTLVLARVGGVHFHYLVRRDDCRAHLLGRVRSERLTGLVESLGRGLAEVHLSEISASGFPVENFGTKLGLYADELRAFGVREPLDGWIGSLRSRAGAIAEGRTTVTFKGLEFSNILADSNFNGYLFDPGPAKADAPEADLARLTLSFRLLYWGTLRFPAFARPAQPYIDTFLSAYRSAVPIDEELYSLLLAKETLKIWRMCRRAVAAKPWPRPVRRIFGEYYVDRFFYRLIGT